MQTLLHLIQENKHILTAYLAEFTLIALALTASFWTAKYAKKHLNTYYSTLKPSQKKPTHNLLEGVMPLLLPFFSLIYVQLLFFISISTIGSSYLLGPVGHIIVAWLFAQGVQTLTHGKLTMWLILSVILPVTLLNIFGLWTPFLHGLDSLALEIGGFRLSLYKVLEVSVSTFLLFWFIGKVTDFTEQSLKKNRSLGVANRALATKLIQIALYILGFFLTLDVLGIDLTTLAVFSGALGVGLGFGLQKITSNFISGLILLFEKSIKATDMVEMADGTVGIIKKITARYTLVQTFDGKEVMIPNESFITQQVINWTHSDAQGRLQVTIGVSYQSDLKKAQTLIFEAINEHPDILTAAPNQCNISEFGNSSVNFLVRFWLRDITLSRRNITGDILMNIWEKFKANGVEFPYPQRDIHIKTPLQLDYKPGK